MMRDSNIIRVLGIETSCDDTSISVVNSNKEILLDEVITQDHKQFKGVFPEYAARNHLLLLKHLLQTRKKDININSIDAFAATSYPGLIGGLVVGVNMAKTFSSIMKKPFIAINHLESHIMVARLFNNNIEFPFLSFLASGGHTQIYLINGINDYKILSSTIDDALGECLDKCAKTLNLGYPGGAEIEKLAKDGNRNKFHFSIPMEHSDPFNFSFSGLKTKFKNTFANIPIGEELKDACASLEMTMSKIICNRLENIILHVTKFLNIPVKQLVFAGGVASNEYFRNSIEILVSRFGIELLKIPRRYCTDNATMVAWLAIEKLKDNSEYSDNLNFCPKPKLLF